MLKEHNSIARNLKNSQMWIINKEMLNIQNFFTLKLVNVTILESTKSKAVKNPLELMVLEGFSLFTLSFWFVKKWVVSQVPPRDLVVDGIGW